MKVVKNETTGRYDVVDENGKVVSDFYPNTYDAEVAQKEFERTGRVPSYWEVEVMLCTECQGGYCGYHGTGYTD